MQNVQRQECDNAPTQQTIIVGGSFNESSSSSNGGIDIDMNETNNCSSCFRRRTCRSWLCVCEMSLPLPLSPPPPPRSLRRKHSTCDGFPLHRATRTLGSGFAAATTSGSIRVRFPMSVSDYLYVGSFAKRFPSSHFRSEAAPAPTNFA